MQSTPSRPYPPQQRARVLPCSTCNFLDHHHYPPHRSAWRRRLGHLSLERQADTVVDLLTATDGH
jgi:hypothetical protein